MANRRKSKTEKKVTRYTYDEIKEPRTPETGHTPLLPADEMVVTLPMDNGWSKAIEVGKLPEGDERPVVVDMDPAADPVLFWAGKRNRREVPVLPLQRNEIVSESRIAQIIERARKAAEEKSGAARQGHLFADLEKTLRESDRAKRVEFYTHEEGWKNKLICGDSLHVMESLLQREGLRGKVQMIYIDPPYGIKYGSNFQQRVDSTKNDDKDKADDVLTIKAFRDTWALGIHSYLSYLEERLYLCRELLAETKGEIRPNTALKSEAARLWCEKMSGTRYGQWRYLLVQQRKFEAAENAGVKSLAELAQSLVVPRPEPQIKLLSIEDESVKGEAFKTLLPLYSLNAAAGSFGNAEAAEPEGWVDAESVGKLDERMFVCRAVGRSMEPTIRDGDYVVLRANPAGSRQGKIVLVQYRGPADPDTGGAFALKRYSSEKTAGSDGSWRHSRILLSPTNPEYQPIVLLAQDAENVRVLAEFVAVLRGIG